MITNVYLKETARRSVFLKTSLRTKSDKTSPSTTSKCRGYALYTLGPLLSTKINDTNRHSLYEFLWIIIKQVVKVIWHKTPSRPQTDGSIVFSRWRQYALPCVYIGATWRIRLNLCFIRPTRVHNPNGKSIVQPFLHSSRQKVPTLYNGRPYPQNCPFWWGIWSSGPHLVNDSVGHSEITIQTVWRSV